MSNRKKQKKVNNFDKELKNLKKRVEKYESLPYQKKLPETYNLIKKKFNNFKEEVDRFGEILDNPEKYAEDKNIFLEDLDDSDKFTIFIEQIEQIKQKFEDDEMSITEELNLYLELHSLSKWCEAYLDKQKIEIVKV